MPRRRRIVASTLALFALAAGSPFAAHAQPLGMPVQPCGTASDPRANDLDVGELAAAAERAIDTQPRNVWPALAKLAAGACAIGSRDVVDRVFARCFTACVDSGDRYLAETNYAVTLERFGDALGAELHFQRAIASRADPDTALTAYTNYAAFLDRSGRPRDALELLNRFALDSGGASSVYPLKYMLMLKLGMRDSPEMAALMRSHFPADGAGGPSFGRAPIDMPLSAIPVEDNPLAQRPFAKRIQVSADVTLEPRAGSSGVESEHLYYRRVSTRDPTTFEPKSRIARGETFDDVVDLGTTGCRILSRGVRYDLDDCPWRAGSARAREAASLYVIVADRIRTEPPVVFAPPPLPLGDTPASEPAPEWMVWSSVYKDLTAAAGTPPATIAATLLERAGLDAGDTAAVRGAAESYLRDVARVDQDLPREIADRYGPRTESRNPATGGVVQFSSPVIVMGFASSVVQIDPRALGGKTLQEALEVDGVIARMDAQKDALLRAHFAALERAIGAAKLAALQSVMRSGLAPNIQRSTRGVQFPRPAAND